MRDSGEITPGELSAERGRTTDLVVLDVREPFEWEIAHLAGARHIPLGQLPARLSELEGHADIVVYCHHGTRSARAVEFLRAAGYSKVRNLTGGIDAWATQVDAETPRY